MNSISRHFRPLLVRSRDDAHRPATELELLFDLVFVIAIAAAAHGLQHAIEAGHVLDGLVKFGMAFFMVWWPWSLFTFFASSFDNDDAAYRVNVIVLMFGAMFVAAAVPGFFKEHNLPAIFVGYVIMRLAFAVLWLRAGRANPTFKITALRYSAGQILLQFLWAAVIFLVEINSPLYYASFAVGVALELFVPWYAEQHTPTPWHRHHIIERFGLLNIIVLGEVLLGSTAALQAAIDAHFDLELMRIALCGVTITLAMWWLYFTEAEHLESTEVKRAFVWAYGHVFVFAAAAAVGAGIGVLTRMASPDKSAGAHGPEGATGVAAPATGDHASAIPDWLSQIEPGAFAVSIPIACYILGIWLVRDRFHLKSGNHYLLLGCAALIALSGFLPLAPLAPTVLLVACLVIRLRAPVDAERPNTA